MQDSDDECLRKRIPSRLHTLDRKPVPEFAATESLFVRHEPLGSAATYIGQIPLPKNVEDQSANREKFCESALDVLYDTKEGNHFYDYEIAKVKVGDIEAFRYEAIGPEKRNERGEKIQEVRRFTLKAIHEPTRCMYPHCTIQLYENGEKFERNDAPKSAKTNIRREFAKLANQYRAEMLATKPGADFGK
jgi:hypothetical protein